MIRYPTPLRYPGGKSAMAGLLGQIRRLNELGKYAMAEPFAGGAGASLSLLYLQETPRIYINDLDKSIYDFWWTVVHRHKLFIDMLGERRISMAEWRRQKYLHRNHGRLSRLRRGFAAFYLNRCNRSGIIMDGGPIGGIEQKGKWKLGARFNKAELRRRCEKIATCRDRIHVSCRDGLKFIESQNAKSIFFFIDPPYFAKGKTLYLNALNAEYHLALANRLMAMTDAAWVLTYDDCPEIRQMYRGWATIRPFIFRYSAADRRSGKEILIAPKWMRLPTSQASAAITW